jgi:hypothetical protein
LTSSSHPPTQQEREKEKRVPIKEIEKKQKSKVLYFINELIIE